MKRCHLLEIWPLFAFVLVQPTPMQGICKSRPWMTDVRPGHITDFYATGSRTQTGPLTSWRGVWKNALCIWLTSRFSFQIALGKQSKLFYSNRTHHTTKKVVSFCTLHPPPPKMVSWLYTHTPILSGVKTEKRIQTLACIVSLATQASCKLMTHFKFSGQYILSMWFIR